MPLPYLLLSPPPPNSHTHSLSLSLSLLPLSFFPSTSIFSSFLSLLFIPIPSPPRYLVHSDIRCGEWLNVYGRKLMVMDCDRHTKEYYLETQGVVQQPVTFPAEGKKVKKNAIAPYNGWGSEEDSLASCIHVNPKRRVKLCTQYLTNSSKALRFRAKFGSPGVEDKVL